MAIVIFWFSSPSSPITMAMTLAATPMLNSSCNYLTAAGTNYLRVAFKCVGLPICYNYVLVLKIG